MASAEPAFPDLTAAAGGLEWREPGLWFGRGQAAVSYPAHGNAASLAIEDRSFWFRHRNRCICNRHRSRNISNSISNNNSM